MYSPVGALTPSLPIARCVDAPPVVVFETEDLRLIVPERPLAEGAVRVEDKRGSELQKFTNWTDLQHNQSYQLITKVVSAWKAKGIHDYLVYGKVTDQGNFGWEVVPYNRKGWSFWQQLKVLWRITFGASKTSKSEREKVKDEILKHSEGDQKRKVEMEAPKGVDYFCQEKTVNTQRVYEGQDVNVLYDYAPVAPGKDQLHFLITPKPTQHAERLFNLSATVYVETQRCAQRLVKFYNARGCGIVHLFDKNGRRAGQSVPHYHQHVVILATKTQEFIGKLTILKNMILGSSKLSLETLKKRVSDLRETLKAI